jgi:hypothetical protein
MEVSMTTAEKIRKATEQVREFNRVWIAGSSWERWKRSPEGRAARLK